MTILRKNGSRIDFTDFWATWCGPCRMQGPVVEQLSEELDGKVSFFKVDVDENQATAEKFGVMSIPTMIIQRTAKWSTQSLDITKKML